MSENEMSGGLGSIVLMSVGDAKLYPLVMFKLIFNKSRLKIIQGMRYCNNYFITSRY